MIKDSGHLRNIKKEHSPAARVFYIFLVFFNTHRVLSRCNTRFRLLSLLDNWRISVYQAANKIMYKQAWSLALPGDLTNEAPE